MRKLFRAAFYRTENKKMIRIELVIAVLLSAFIILNGYFQTNLTNAYIYKLVARFFGYSLTPDGTIYRRICRIFVGNRL